MAYQNADGTLLPRARRSVPTYTVSLAAGVLVLDSGRDAGVRFDLVVNPLPPWIKEGRTPSGTYVIVALDNGNEPSAIVRQMVVKDFLSPAVSVSDRQYWLQISRLDGEIDDTTRVGLFNRTGLRLHAGSISLGCLTFRDRGQYALFVSQLAGAPPAWVDPTGAIHSSAAPGRKRVFGTIRIP